MNKSQHRGQDMQPEAVRQMLNRSLQQIDQPVLVKLQDARKLAMSHYRVQQTAPAFVWSGFALGGSGHTGAHRKVQYWAAAILLAACLFSGIAYWQQISGDADSCDTCEQDLAILTGDLPVYVYTD